MYVIVFKVSGKLFTWSHITVVLIVTSCPDGVVELVLLLCHPAEAIPGVGSRALPLQDKNLPVFVEVFEEDASADHFRVLLDHHAGLLVELRSDAAKREDVGATSGPLFWSAHSNLGLFLAMVVVGGDQDLSVCTPRRNVLALALGTLYSLLGDCPAHITQLNLLFCRNTDFNLHLSEVFCTLKILDILVYNSCQIVICPAVVVCSK